MKNLTLAIDDGTLREARIRAAEEGTSVNQVVREYLEEYAARRNRHRRTIRAILELSRKASGSSGGRRWTRAELHER